MPQSIVSNDDAQHIAELALMLQNFSYSLNDMACNEASLDRDNITASLFTLHRQVDDISGRLQNLSMQCRSCAIVPDFAEKSHSANAGGAS